MNNDGRGRAVTEPAELWRQWFDVSTRMWSDFFGTGREGAMDPYGLYRQWFSGLDEMRNRMLAGPQQKAPGGATGMEGASPVEKATLVPAMNPLANASVEGAQNLWRQWYEAVSEGARRSASLSTEMARMGPRWAEALKQVRNNFAALESYPTDPLQFATQWYNATSGPYSDLTADLIEREEFLEQGSRFLQNYASFYKVFKRNSEEYLKNLQVPVRSDITRVAELVVALEEKVDKLDESFEDFEDGFADTASADSVASIEEHIAGLERKLNTSAQASARTSKKVATAESVAGIEDRIAGLEQKLDASARVSAEASARVPDGAATAESVGNVEGRLDRVEGKLDRLLSALENAPQNGGASAEAAQSAPSQSAPSQGTQEQSARADDEEPELRATAAARRRASENGVDLSEVEGTGAGGQITVDDVRRKEEG